MNIFPSGQAFHFGEVVYQPGGRFGPRLQENLQLVAVHRGEAVVAVEGRERYLGPGQATLLLPGRRESFVFGRTEETHHTWGEAVQPELTETDRRRLDSLPAVLPWTERLEALLRLGLTTRSNRAPARRPGVADHLGRALFCAWGEEAGWTEDPAPSVPTVVAEVRRYLTEHLGEPLAAGWVARAVGLSPQHLSRLCRQHLGQTPTRLLADLRLARAEELLRSTGLSVKEVAARTGFANPFHFSRKMRERHGLCPRAWRGREWGRPAPDGSGTGSGEDREAPLFAPTLRVVRAGLAEVEAVLARTPPASREAGATELRAAAEAGQAWAAFRGDVAVGAMSGRSGWLGSDWVGALQVAAGKGRQAVAEALLERAEGGSGHGLRAVLWPGQAWLAPLLSRRGYRPAGRLGRGRRAATLWRISEAPLRRERDAAGGD